MLNVGCDNDLKSFLLSKILSQPRNQDLRYPIYALRRLSQSQVMEKRTATYFLNLDIVA